jgi:hypothetical protein
MAEETKVILRLDVDEAKRAIASLSKDGEVAGTKASSGVRSAIRRGLSQTGLGSPVQDSIHGVTSRATGGIGDVIGETFNTLSAQFERYALGTIGEDARASMAAREDLIRVFGYSVGATDKLQPGMKEWFNSAKTLRQAEEHGRTLVNASGQFQGPGIEKIIERITKALAELLSGAVKELGELLNPAHWFGKGR